MITLGRGLTNELEIGMTIGQAARHRPDLIVKRHRTKPWPFGEWQGYSGAIPALGLEIRVRTKSEPITRIVLFTDPNTTTNRFYGALSCGLSFQGGRIVPRKEIVQLFGEPPDPGISEVIKYLKAYKDVVWRVDANTKVLYYPSNGVFFRLRRDVVDAVTIVRGPTHSPAVSNWPTNERGLTPFPSPE